MSLPDAEQALGLRMVKAAKNIGLEAQYGCLAYEAKAFEPDLIFNLHHSLPKVLDYPTLSCLWSSPIYFANNVQNILSNDAHCVGNEPASDWLDKLMYTSPRKLFKTVLYPSTQKTEFYEVENFIQAAYVGSNWDNSRHKGLFNLLDRAKDNSIGIYGPKYKWNWLKHIYEGHLQYDENATLELYRRTGIGIAFQQYAQFKDNAPSMRVFEIAAAGAVCISDELPFTKANFKDTVLYVDTKLPPEELAESLQEKINWIKNNPSQAKEMARAAHEIFSKNYCLEKLLERVVEDSKSWDLTKPYHYEIEDNNQENISIKTPLKNTPNIVQKAPSVEIIMRTDGKRNFMLRRAINSIINQTYKNISILIVYFGKNIASFESEIFAEFSERISIKVISSQATGYMSQQTIDGLQNVNADYIGFLDDDDYFFKDHIKSLVTLLSVNPEIPLAYSGAVKFWEFPLSNGSYADSTFCSLHDSSELTYFYNFDREKLFELRNYITVNSYLVRRECIPLQYLFKADPKIKMADDFVFLLCILQKYPRFIFSELVTCAFSFRVTQNDNSTFAVGFDKSLWDIELIINKVSRFRSEGEPGFSGNISFDEIPERARLFWVVLTVYRSLKSICRKVPFLSPVLKKFKTLLKLVILKILS